jgi:hypothetical protein
MMAASLRILPPGRCRQELSALLWTWNMQVQMTLAAHGERGIGHGHETSTAELADHSDQADISETLERRGAAPRRHWKS